MRPHDRNIMYYNKMPVEIDIDDDVDPTRPSSPSWNSDTSMYWGLSQRIDNTEKQTRELSIQSERQIRLIQAITKSQNQHELEQREAMTSLLSRIEQNETGISGLQHATQSLCLNQRQTQQDVRVLREELQALREQVKAQQQPRRATVLRSVIRGPVAQALNLAQPSKSSEQVTTTVGPIFKDVYGRRRRLCQYCGENLDASYCVRHERNEVCRRRGSSNRGGVVRTHTIADHSSKEARH